MKIKENWEFKENSLDLLRLIAASQVMLLHTIEFTMHETKQNLFFDLLKLFPGVPIFFFVSGYLISRSFETSPSLSAFWKNRCLRIFPALILCVIVNLLMIWSTGYFKIVKPDLMELTTLFFAKITFLQFYNPDFMRGFGDGVLNGSLWTICVELQFYVITPFLYRLINPTKNHSTTKIVALIFFFAIANRALFLLHADYSGEVLWKLYRVSFVPWVYMFLFGILVQRNFELFAKYVLIISLHYLLITYIFVMFAMSFFGIKFDNSIPPLVFFSLAILAFKMGYSFIKTSKYLLKGNDISYGIYIWHMPFVNQALYLTTESSYFVNICIFILTIISAYISWILVERNAIALKKYSMRLTE
jgi:peptidoglycan/LPS O-acetylase OafA/YrhL